MHAAIGGGQSLSAFQSLLGVLAITPEPVYKPQIPVGFGVRLNRQRTANLLLSFAKPALVKIERPESISRKNI